MSAAAALAAALRDGTRIPALPTAEPSDLATAYAVQDAVAAATGPVGGWKVGPLRDGESRCSPLPRAFFHPSPAFFPASTAQRWLVEAEIAVRFARDVRAAVSPAVIADAIGTIHPALECVTSRFETPAAVPDLHRLADLQNAGAVVLGPGLADWQGLEFIDLAATLDLDGVPVARTTAAPSTAITLAALCWLARHVADRGQSLRAGDVVITGARLGPVPLGPVPLTGRRTARADFGPLGAVELSCA